MTMKKALVEMSKNGNKKAMTRKVAAENGVSEVEFSLWTSTIENLRAAVGPYVIGKMKDGASDEELNKIYVAIFPEWKKVKDFSDDLLIDDLRADVNSIIGFAESWIADPDKGTIWCVESGLLFRKAVEAYLGAKIRKNPVLTGEEKELVEAYNKAVRKVNTNTDKLNGTVDAEGKPKEIGILDRIKVAESNVAEIEKRIKETARFHKESEGEAAKFFDSMIEGFKADREAENKSLAALRNTKNQLEEQIKKAKKVIKDNKKQYKEIMGRIR